MSVDVEEDAYLENVRETDTSALLGDHRAEILDEPVFAERAHTSGSSSQSSWKF
jgi:hypothetical protein